MAAPTSALPDLIGELSKASGNRRLPRRRSHPVNEEPDRLLDVAEAAKRLGLPVSALRRRRIVPVVRIGRRVRFSVSAIDAFIAFIARRSGA